VPAGKNKQFIGFIFLDLASRQAATQAQFDPDKKKADAQMAFEKAKVGAEKK